MYNFPVFTNGPLFYLDSEKEKEEIQEKKVIESYESWRERILKEAYEKINQ